MRRAVTAGAAALAIAGAGAAEAQQRVYGGEEVEALRCAHLFLFTSITMHELGYLGEGETMMMAGAAQMWLDRYVSGSMEEKYAAMTVIMSRRTVLGTYEEFMQIGESCMERFPLG